MGERPALVRGYRRTRGPIGPVASGIAGKCADVDHSAVANAAHVQLWDCNSSGAQQWQVRSGALVNPHSVSAPARSSRGRAASRTARAPRRPR
ncbi:MAG: RICIN domain-containing protein [Umezawaea sp.]